MWGLMWGGGGVEKTRELGIHKQTSHFHVEFVNHDNSYQICYKLFLFWAFSLVYFLF